MDDRLDRANGPCACAMVPTGMWLEFARRDPDLPEEGAGSICSASLGDGRRVNSCYYCVATVVAGSPQSADPLPPSAGSEQPR